MEGLGAWQSIIKTANPIRHIHVSNQNHFGFVHLHAEMMQVEAMGYVVIARELGKVLLKKIHDAKNIDLICPASVNNININSAYAEVTLTREDKKENIKSKLLIVADGTQSKLRELLNVTVETKDYQQTAIVTNVTPGQPHKDTAYERFTETGPLALLPLTQQRCAVVFTTKTQDAEYYLDITDKDFLSSLQKRFGRRLGTFQHIGKRKSYPIKQVFTNEQINNRVVILGNAAHTIHPNGAQGFNLGLRDVAGLAELLIPALRAGKDPGDRILLEKYLAFREQDQKRTLCLTDGLASLFYNELPHKVIARNAGMMLTNITPPLKKLLMRKAMGLYGKQPSLVRSIPL